MKTIESILTVIGALYVIASTLAGVLPSGSRAQAVCARLALALKGVSKPDGVDPKALLLLVLCLPTMASCASPRHAIRGGVLTMAKAARELDSACAEAAKTSQDLTLAEACAQGYGVAREALISAEIALDSWSESDQSRALCAASKGAKAIVSSAGVATKAGAKLSPVVVDALKVADAFAGHACN